MSNLIHRLDASLPFSKTERIIIAIVVLLHALPAIIELLHWNPSAPKPDDERVMANLVSPDAAKSAQQQPPAAPPPKPKQEEQKKPEPKKQEQKKVEQQATEKNLHPDLVPMADKGRKFVILFDYETKPKTKQQIFQATRRTASVIVQQGCECVVALLPGPEKGIDDWVVALGKKAEKSVTTMVADALTLAEYQQRFFINRARGLYKYKPNVIVKTRYLSYSMSNPC